MADAAVTVFNAEFINRRMAEHRAKEAEMFKAGESEIVPQSHITRNCIEIHLSRLAEDCLDPAATTKFVDVLEGATLYDMDGNRLKLGKPMLVTGKGFRIPLTTKTADSRVGPRCEPTTDDET